MSPRSLLKLTLPVLLALASAPLLQAQLVEVTAHGIVASVEGSSKFGVQVGDTFTETFEISSATPGTHLQSGLENYLGAGTDSVTAGSYSITSSGAFSSATIYSAFSGSEYGYMLRETYNTSVPVYADIDLIGFDAAVAPSTSLSSIGEFPLSDFSGSSDSRIDYVDNVDDFGFAAEISSYTVTTVAVPEPSSSALALAAMAALILLVHGPGNLLVRATPSLLRGNRTPKRALSKTPLS